MKSNGINFSKHLHDEKIDAQNARAEYVVRKLIFATALLGGGVTSIENFNLSALLYLAPYVTIAFDLYYLAEDYSIKRIGGFLSAKSMNPIEREWEKWVNKNRDPFAPFSMSFLTSLITLGAAFASWQKGVIINDLLFFFLFGFPLLISWILFFHYKNLKEHVYKNLYLLKNKNNHIKLPEDISKLRDIVQNADHCMNQKVYEKIKKYFLISVTDPDIQKKMLSITSEYRKDEFFRCVNNEGKTLETDREIIDDFHDIVAIHPEFEAWFKEDVLLDTNTKKPVLLVARWLCHLIGLRHLSVHLFIDHPEHNNYTLVQVRSLDKFESPGKFDLPAAGHIIGVENATNSLQDELKEELGLDPKDLTSIIKINGYEYIEPLENANIRNIEFRIVYKSKIKPESLAKIEFLDHEVAAISTFSLSELQNLIKNHSEKVASGLSKSFPFYFKDRL